MAGGLDGFGCKWLLVGEELAVVVVLEGWSMDGGW